MKRICVVCAGMVASLVAISLEGAAQSDADFAIPTVARNCPMYSSYNAIIGPTEASETNPYRYGCSWNGPVWHYADSLVALASPGGRVTEPRRGAVVTQVLPELEAGFANPPDDAKLQVWWHWLTKSTTKKGVEADLKAMKEMEISTAHIFVPGFSGMPDRTGKILTPEWMDVFTYAIERANHYGIKLGFHNCPGWSASGGPWITADNSMQVLASSALDTELAVGKLKLPDPPRKGFYEDVAVFAFPADAKAEVVKVTSDCAAR